MKIALEARNSSVRRICTLSENLGPDGLAVRRSTKARFSERVQAVGGDEDAGGAKQLEFPGHHSQSTNLVRRPDACFGGPLCAGIATRSRHRLLQAAPRNGLT